MASKTSWALGALIAILGVFLLARLGDNGSSPKPPATTPANAKGPRVAGGGEGGNQPVVRSTKTLKLDKGANVIPDLDKEARTRDLTAKEALESKFRNWRDDGRKQFEEIFQGDRERTGAVMRSLFQNEQFRAMFQQTRELEAKWPKATDDEKAAIMAQMEGIRTKGMAMVRAEAARQTGGSDLNQGNLQVQTSGGATLVVPNQPTPAPATPAAPAPPPVIIM